MQHLSVLGGLLLVCAASLVRSAFIIEDGAPILWTHTTNNLNDLTVENGDLVPNPWHYLERMSLMRVLMEATNSRMGSMGADPAETPLWGPTLELAWMLTSGRLADPTTDSTCGKESGDTMCISPNSMWACVHYFVSVLPFLSAAEQGFFGDGFKVRMRMPAGAEEFCSTHADCTERFREITLKWDHFYQTLRAPIDDTVPEAIRKDTLLGLFWDAQMAAKSSCSICDSRKDHLSPTELLFAKGWMSAAGYVSATRFQSNFNNSEALIVRLPGRVLTESDATGEFVGLGDEEKHTLSVFSWMLEIDGFVGGSLLSMWAKTMCNVDMRARGREMVEQLMLNQDYATSSFVNFVTVMAVINC